MHELDSNGCNKQHRGAFKLYLKGVFFGGMKSGNMIVSRNKLYRQILYFNFSAVLQTCNTALQIYLWCCHLCVNKWNHDSCCTLSSIKENDSIKSPWFSRVLITVIFILINLFKPDRVATSLVSSPPLSTSLSFSVCGCKCIDRHQLLSLTSYTHPSIIEIHGKIVIERMLNLYIGKSAINFNVKT